MSPVTTYRYTATATDKARMIVSYECENCQKPVSSTEEIEARISKSTSSIGKYSNYQQAERAKVSATEAARRTLKRRMEKRFRQTRSRRSRCPHCGYLQSWMIRYAKRSRGYLMTAVLWPLAVAIFLFVRLRFHEFAGSGNEPCFFCLAVQFAAVGVAYVVNNLIPFRPNKDYAAVTRVNEPTVSWELPPDLEVLGLGETESGG